MDHHAQDPDPSLPLPIFAQTALLNTFRIHYTRFQTQISELDGTTTDATVIARLGDDFDEFAHLVEEVTSFLLEPSSFIHSGGRGRPRTVINAEFLGWAYGRRSTSGIARFLGISRPTVRTAILEAGVGRTSRESFCSLHVDGSDDLLDPDLPIPPGPLPEDVQEFAHSRPVSYTGPVSGISDDDLDGLILRLRSHYRRAGLSMLNGMLRRLGHRVPIQRIRESLLRIDPVRRVFERIRIRRRQYRVLGPNALWHHDGQHGSSVHNIRIERLWVDVTVQVTEHWIYLFEQLELHYGLDVANVAHIWLLHFLFLGTLNSALSFFAEGWNEHTIQIRNAPNRSPVDMFVFDMFTCGVRGDRLPPEEENLTQEDLESHGIDWQALHDDEILHSQRINNSSRESDNSWVGQAGPPAQLSHVLVDPPAGTLTDAEITALANMFSHLVGSSDETDVYSLWTQALVYCRYLYPNVF
ncbi:hypothetical protein GGX14DRAFT_371776 [Mycena pura]|uniref:Integrase core domain-containing protein n=1 Tax=Mycena pura TaxID=153505 RepID=A0AAD6Y4I6_9AGAR|nr:hypothetical protein GGX14DRAFT_371776 [Mycena pura]